jgi:hypothetical protein
MGLAQLDNLVRIRQLKAEPVAQSEIDGLVRSGKSRLRDAQTESLSLDGRFDLAYNAAHAFSLAALRWHRYRSENRYALVEAIIRAANEVATRVVALGPLNPGVK